MVYFIIISKKDEASLNIKENLLRDYNFIKHAHFFDNNEVFILNPKMKKAFTVLKEEVKAAINQDSCFDFEYTVEVTHHGPFTETPSVFIEIGSNEEQWKNKEAGKIIADVIFKTITDVSTTDMSTDAPKTKSVIVFGGGHYSPAANNILENTEYAVGHMASKYAAEHLDEDLVRQMYIGDMNNISFAVLDWKGLGAEKKRLVKILDRLKIPYQKQ